MLCTLYNAKNFSAIQQLDASVSIHLTAMLYDAIILMMTTLTVRKLDDNIYRRLRIRAAKDGVSMEEEARRILTRAVSTPERLSKVFNKYFGEKHGVNLQLTRKPHEPMDFNE